MKWKEQKGGNHILVPGKDILSNMLYIHTAGQGTLLCTPWERRPLTLLPTRKKVQGTRVQQRPEVAITAISILGMPSKFLAPSKGKIRDSFSPREFLVRN